MHGAQSAGINSYGRPRVAQLCALYRRASSFSFGRALVNRAPLPRRVSSRQAVLRRARQLVLVVVEQKRVRAWAQRRASHRP